MGVGGACQPLGDARKTSHSQAVEPPFFGSTRAVPRRLTNADMCPSYPVMDPTTPETLTPAPETIDAAESHWDDWILVLYLRELAEEHRPTVH